MLPRPVTAFPSSLTAFSRHFLNEGIPKGIDHEKLNAIRVTQRATAKMLGVDHRTIGRDLRGGENSPKPEPAPAPIKDENVDIGENSPKPPDTIAIKWMRW